MKNLSRRFLIVMSVALAAAGCLSTGSDDLPEFTVGLITNNSNGLRNVEGFIEGMTELGYVRDQNVRYLFAGEPVSAGDLEQALTEMVEADVDLIFTAGTPTGVAAARATAGSQTPVVFGVIADPIEAGVLEDLSLPGGNMTGVKLSQDQSKRLEMLREIDPSVARVLVPFNPSDTAATTAVDQISRVAPALGIELVLVTALNDADVLEGLRSMPGDVDAVFLVPDSLVNAHLAEIVALATARNLPTSGPSTAQVDGGALFAYGFRHHAAGSQAARIANQVLKGADPGSLAIQDTESFLAINLATAAEIGLDIPDHILQRADIVLRPEPKR